jgi:TRAP-type C4-dicarboxylate transport system substrate-binding protein|tara:strand:+ start:45532 stop:46695 length:1164 start_codon:yes stop_codon:yes gene_type:complete
MTRLFKRLAPAFKAGIAIGALSLGTAAGAQEKELRYAFGISPTFATYPAIERYAEMLSEDPGLNVKVYAMSLLTVQETMAGLRDGIADIGWETAPYHPAEFAETNLITNLTMLMTTGKVPDLPGTAMAGAVLEYVMLNCPDCLKEIKAQNAVFTASTATPPYYLLCNKPVATIEQLQGKRIRSGAPNFSRWAEKFGATGVSLPGNEIYDALGQGIVDCTTNDVGQLLGLRFIDVTSSVTLGVPGGVYGGTLAANFNRDVWQGLTEAQRLTALKAAARFSADSVLMYHQSAEEARATAEGKGIEFFEPSEELAAATAQFVQDDLATIAQQFKETYGIEDVDAKIELARGLIDKWKGLVEGTGTDLDAITQLYWDEVYSKVDAATYGMD